MNKVKKYTHYGLAIFPLLDGITSNIMIILFVISGLFNYSRDKSYLIIDGKQVIKHILILALPLILLLISIIWSDNFNNGLSFIERSLMFALMPIVLFVLKPFKNKGEIILFQKIYIISTSILALIVILALMYDFINQELFFDSSDYISILRLRTKIDNIPFFNEHPIYLTLIMGTGVIILYYNKFKTRLANALCFIVMFSVILIASSRGPILGLMIVFSAIILLQVKSKLKAVGSLVIFFVLIGGVFFVSPMNSRIFEMVNTKNILPEGIHYNSFNLRVGIYKCDLEIIENTPLWGYGPGSVQKKLDDCYKRSFNTKAYEYNIYNTHNQYFFYCICFGLIGFTLIMVTYYFFLKRAYINKDLTYLFFLVFFMISFLTENVLNRNTGIMLFGIFNPIFYYKTYLKDDSCKR